MAYDHLILKGTTSKIIEVMIRDSTTGQGKTGLTYAAMTIYFQREGAASPVSVTPVTMTLGTYVSGGFVEVDATHLPGLYQFSIPSAALASGANAVTFGFSASGILNKVLRIVLSGIDIQNANNAGMNYLSGDVFARLGAPSGASIAADIASTLAAAQLAADRALTNEGEISAIQSYLNANLDNPISAVLTAIGNLNNLSALANIYGPQSMEIPDSSSTLYPFTIVVHDNEGKLVDLDAPPTLAAANAVGTDRSANLSSPTRTGVGRYTFTYSVNSAAPEEAVRITGDGAVSSDARHVEYIGAVVNYDTLTTLADIQSKAATAATQSTNAATSAASANTKLGTPAVSVTADIAALQTTANSIQTQTNKIPASPATEGSASAAASSAASAASTAGTINTKIGTPTLTISGDIAAVKTIATAVQTQTDKIPASPATEGSASNAASNAAAAKVVTDKMSTMLTASGSNYTFTADAVKNAPAGGGGGGTAPNITVEITEVRT